MRSLVLLATLWAPPEPEATEEAPGPSVQRPSRLRLEWTAPAACPEIDEVRERLRARLPGVDEPLPRDAAPLEAQVTVAGGGADGFDVRMSLTNDRGTSERVFSSRDCSLLTDAAVLVIAVTLDPVTTVAGVGQGEADDASPGAVDKPEIPPEASEGTEPTSEPVVPDDRGEGASDVRSTTISEPKDAPPQVGGGRTRAASRSGESLQFGLRGLGGGGFGPTNTGYATLGGSLAVFGDRWRVAADGRWVARRSVIQQSGAGGHFDAWLLGAVGCFVPLAGPVELPLCAGVEAGQVRGRGIPTLAVVEEATFPFAALRLGQGIAWAPIERLAIGVDLELAAPLTRGEFVVDEIVIQRVAPINVRGVLGVELRLP